MDYQDVQRCAACGGKCCQLYTKRCEGGQLPDFVQYANDSYDKTQNFDYYIKHSVWHVQRASFDIKPRYDVLEAYRAWCDSYIYDDSSLRKQKARKYLQDLRRRGIDMGYCAYWTKESGCLVDWEKRPAICKEHRCQDWINEEVD